MTVAIIGPTSYVAERLIDALEKSAQSYVLISLRKRGSKDYSCCKNMYYVDELGLQDVLNMEIDSVVLCASLSASDCEADPAKAYSVNTDITCRLVEKLATSGTKRFLYLSTIKVYGEKLTGKISEETKANPQSVYARTHYEAEKILSGIAKVRGIEVLLLRLSNVFGAPVRKSHSGWSLATNCFAQQMAMTGRVNVLSPDAIRNIVPMNSLIVFIEMWIRREVDAYNCSVLNIGSCANLSMGTIARLVKAAYSRQSRYDFQEFLELEEVGLEFSVQKMRDAIKGSFEGEIDMIKQELTRLCSTSRKLFSGRHG